MTTRSCELCHDAVASVFRPSIALCRRCHRDLDTLESFDNECENCPTCPDCGHVLNNTSQVCPECWTTRLIAGSRKLATRG